jgi:hypothetical protein
LGPDQRTAIKARGLYDPRYEAGQMIATTDCRNVEIVLAMWVSSTVMVWMASASGCEAVTRPTMRFVEIKSAEQQSVLMLQEPVSYLFVNVPR